MRNSLIFRNVSVEQLWVLFFIFGTFSTLSKDALVFRGPSAFTACCIVRIPFCSTLSP